MQIKEGFTLLEVGVQHIVVATEERCLEFAGMVRLNDTGAFLFERLQQPTTAEALVDALLDEYDTTRERAQADVEAFLALLHKENIMKGDQ